MAETEPKIETENGPEKVDQSGDNKPEEPVIEVPENQMIQIDQSPEAQLMAKMDELKVETEEEIPRPKLSQLFLAISKLNFEEVRLGLAHDDTLKMQSEASQKLLYKNGQLWIPIRSSLLQGALRISRFFKEIPILDFILELIDMGANTNLTDAENKTAFDIYMDQFQNFDMKKFSIKDNHLYFRLQMYLMKKLAVNHCNQSSSSYLFYQKFLEEGRTHWKGFTEEAQLLFNETNCVPKCPFENEAELDDKVNLEDLAYFLNKPYEQSLQATVFCSYFYGKLDLAQKDSNGQDILVKMVTKLTNFETIDKTIELLKSYDFDFRALYTIEEKLVTAFGMISRQVQDLENRVKKEPAHSKKKKFSNDLKILKRIMPKLQMAVFETLEMKPDPSVQALFNAEVESHAKYEEKTASDSVFEERIEKLETRIVKLEIDAKKSSKAENDLRNQLKRVESRNQSLEANFQNQDRIIKQLLRDIEALKNSQSPQTENQRPKSNQNNRQTQNQAQNRQNQQTKPNQPNQFNRGNVGQPQQAGSLTPNRKSPQKSLTPNRLPNQKSPNSLMPQRIKS